MECAQREQGVFYLWDHQLDGNCHAPAAARFEVHVLDGVVAQPRRASSDHASDRSPRLGIFAKRRPRNVNKACETTEALP